MSTRLPASNTKAKKWIDFKIFRSMAFTAYVVCTLIAFLGLYTGM